jgi:hypothetical protein
MERKPNQIYFGITKQGCACCFCSVEGWGHKDCPRDGVEKERDFMFHKLRDVKEKVQSLVGIESKTAPEAYYQQELLAILEILNRKEEQKGA